MRKFALYSLGLVVAALVALGLVILSSASETNAIRLHSDRLFFMKRQFMYMAAGAAIAIAAARLDYHIWRDRWVLTGIFVVGVLAMLAWVFAFDPINGSRRWISLGPLRLQPSEFAKPAAVIAIAVWMDKMALKVETFIHGVAIPSAFLAVLLLPIILEPDFGSVMVVALSGFMVMFLAGAKILHFTPAVLAGVAVFAYRVWKNPNRMARMAAFLGFDLTGSNISADASSNAAYQTNQALVAISNGGLWGVGLTQSMQKHHYLPEAHTDFIFAILAEELGAVFTSLAILLFVLFFVFSCCIAYTSSDRLGRFIAFGMAFIVFFQAMFNIGVVCHALPTKGMALPFFSYGGTSMLSSFLAVGLIFSVGLHSGEARRPFALRKTKK